jgi:hypothetical protein
MFTFIYLEMQVAVWGLGKWQGLGVGRRSEHAERKGRLASIFLKKKTTFLKKKTYYCFKWLGLARGPKNLQKNN